MNLDVMNSETFDNDAPAPTTTAGAEHPSSDRIAEAALTACKRIAPVWPLADFVAVNPMQGHSSEPFGQASAGLRDILGQDLLMPRAYYREAHERGLFTEDHLAAALAELEGAGFSSPGDVRGALADNAMPTDAVPTFADRVSEGLGQDWSSFVVDQITFWAGGYFDKGQALWRNPWAGKTPYAAWKAQASLDRSPEIAGLLNFRDFVAGLPDDPREVLCRAVFRLQLPREVWTGYFHRLLATIGGWAGHLRYRGWQGELAGEEPTAMLDILAIRAAYDLALFEHADHAGLAPVWRRDLWEAFAVPQPSGTTGPEDVAQRALELAYKDKLLGDIGRAAAAEALRGAPVRPSVQAVFCIDVRSERFRRNLESVDNSIRTYGFAGFFGLPIAISKVDGAEAQAQCPVLLTPQHVLHESCSDSDRDAILTRKAALASWKRFKNAAVSSFSFVEAMGLGFLGALLRDSASRPAPEGRRAGPLSLSEGTGGLTHEQMVAYAESMLAGMSLGEGLARIVLLAGHGSTTTNNPYASGLDCGACGGHAGDSNARAAAAILNDPGVRKALAEKGRAVPDDTVFLAGLHDTVTDELAILEGEAVPAGHADDLADLVRKLEQAGYLTRRERAVELAIGTTENTCDEVRRRSADWSQVRPEWGLAGCASFIVAPRERTSQVDLAGRAFLHSYDWRADEDNSLLELIMTAPLVVGSWINLQYYASVVNNTAYGSGDKTLHNVVGGFGILEGNGGDLRSWLPLQSVHDGEKPYHVPLRLAALIEAPAERIDAVLTKHSHVADLFDNGWLSLIAIEDEGRNFLRYHAIGSWERVETPDRITTRKDAA